MKTKRRVDLSGSQTDEPPYSVCSEGSAVVRNAGQSRRRDPARTQAPIPAVRSNPSPRARRRRHSPLETSATPVVPKPKAPACLDQVLYTAALRPDMLPVAVHAVDHAAE